MSQRPVVLVVEDDLEMNELECELLAAYGLGSVPAYTGTEAIELSRTTIADAVLLDVMLPEMDGFETCQRLRQFHRHLPIVLVTALDSDDCRRRGFEAGANAYFAKPFNPDEIVGTLQRLLAANGNGGNGGNGGGH